ncbi:MAG: right-handed parallel beta-helix repeat-containing protein [Sedimentisphaerales bacterium]|jgi:hypothetical protein
MKRQILIGFVALLAASFLPNLAVAKTIPVPSRTYHTIQDGINAAVTGDVVVVAPGTYTGPGNVNLDFGAKNITVISQVNSANPNWDIINSTIIDCAPGGAPDDGGDANRAFYFHNGQTANSKVIGFTIKNGYARGPKGDDGQYGFFGQAWREEPSPGLPWQTMPPLDQLAAGVDPCTLPPHAFDGCDVSGNGYGGGIYCIGSSPSIQYCVFEDCTVTGAHGGKGADGLDGSWSYYTWADFNWVGPDAHSLLPTATLKNNTGGQWAGNGGYGFGNGYGGAIACTGSGSNPLISGCIFRNNSAQGGRGGNGGKGGNAATTDPANPYTGGNESSGGDAGLSVGGGIGGAIYAAANCNPVIKDCNFEDDIAKTGPRGTGGERGFGNVVTPRVTSKGAPSFVFPSNSPSIAGGAVYFAANADANFTNCEFVDNKAYHAFFFDPNYYAYAGYPTYPEGSAQDIAGYTVGGAVFCAGSSDVTINTCDFLNNMGGALNCGVLGSCNININNNYAVSQGQPGRKSTFQGNTDPHSGSELYYGPPYGSPPSYDYGMGGAIYIDALCTVNISNANFGGNRAKIGGGAIESLSDVNISDCAFSGNIADGNDDLFTGFGGAIDVYTGSTLLIDINNCSFVGNESKWGGALSSEAFTGTLNNCFFIDNKAEIGGALDLGMGTVDINDSVLSGNRAAQGNGGGISCRYTEASIENCEFSDNSAGGSFGSGGAIDIDGASDLIDIHTVKNCLFTGNSASFDGGAINCAMYVEPQIQNCTFSENSAGDFGGAIFTDWASEPNIQNCIIQKSNNHAIHEEDAGGNAIATYCLFFNNPNGHYYDSGTKLVYSDANIGSIPNGSHNTVGNPLFVTGTLGDYYLSQIAAGQGVNSPAVDSGSASASSLGLNTRTTRTDDVGDTGQVDIGYHFSKTSDVPRFQLTTSIIAGQGTISQSPLPLSDGNYLAGTVVTVTATPQSGWVIKDWAGTDDDSEVTTTNKVVMNTDRFVTVEFRQPQTFIVAVGGGDGYYANIADAMHDANDGDIIVVYPGIYYGPELQFTKSVEVRSLSPDDPNWVAQTIIDSNGHGLAAIMFPLGTNSGAVLNGFTIRNSRWYTVTGDNGANPGENGGDGLGLGGGAIWIGPQAGPIIKNCVIRDNSVLGGFGGNGANANVSHNAGRGGWGGWARGGAVYCSELSYPQFINCRILNNRVVGGFGGNGGNYAAPGGHANYGGNFSRAEWWNYDPRDLSQEWVQGDLWQRWTDMAPYISYNNMTIRVVENYGWIDDYWEFHYGYIGDYRWYSGYGGGVFVNKSSNVTFTNCEISGNLAQGGFSGLGGNQFGGNGPDRPEPFPTKYEIPAFGGGVYIAAESNVIFNGCVINNNTASDPTFDHRTALGTNSTLTGYIPQNYDPCNHYRLTPYLGHGGGVCAEDTAAVTFIDCNFSGNRASVGGGLFGAQANLTVSNTEFVSNRAYQGGGMFGQDGPMSIQGCQFLDNVAPDDANDPNVIGIGGGLHLWSVISNIVDTTIIGNDAEGMGGGAYFGGEGPAILKNCLIVDNNTIGVGGGVSATDFAQLTVSNCTVADNTASGVGQGGGVYAAYESYVDIINSILWDNTAFDGNQIAIGTQDSPAGVNVSYSDVKDGNVGVAMTPGTTLTWALSNKNADPLFVADFFLSQVAAGQDANSPCVDAGSDLASILGLAQYTTRTDSVVDDANVDMGYHHPLFTPQMYSLTVAVSGSGGTVTPTSGTYSRGTVVTLTADPCTAAGYRVQKWTGTDDDNSVAPTNTITMTGDEYVTVEFGKSQVLTVPGDYTNIQAAIGAAKPGDIVKVASGVYHGGRIIMDKEITVTSTNPDDPCVVASTIINSSGYTDIAVLFTTGATGKTVLDGFTITGGTYNPVDAIAVTVAGQNGNDGYFIAGGAVYIANGSSPTIKNCVIRDTNITGGNASNGANADATHPAGRGGWAGLSYGGGVFVDSYANPTFIKCTVTNCIAGGGNAGNGGNSSGTAYGAPDYQDANHGGSWSNDSTFPWRSLINSSGQSYFADYPYYSGLGGGVFCSYYSSATFITCNITNNLAVGGMSGIGGTRPVTRPDPVFAYRIPSYGGGVFCAGYSSVTFTDCNIMGNTAPRPDETYHTDPYLGYGGGIAFDSTAYISFENCNITDNNAAVGGGMYWTGGAPQVQDSNISGNTAYVGGGIYGTESDGLIQNCIFSYNFAGVSPNDIDVNAVGEGGGIYSAAMDVNIVDCFFTENVADTSGGGVYASGPTATPLLIKNGLFTNNRADRDGGGISANWYSDSNIVNCTIVNNVVGTLGGGLSSSYGSNANVLNTIIWDNKAGIGATGSQIAVSSGAPYDNIPATVQVSYSDVQDANDPNAFNSTVDALDLAFCIDTTGSMGDDIAAVQAAARQITNAIADKFPNHRIGLVDYRDYYDPNDTNAYGSPGDWPYRDDVQFTTDSNAIINGLQPLAASGGGDYPEAVYTALMHCIDANLLAARLTANGQARFIDPNSPGLGNWRPGRRVLRVILLMGDAPPHSPEPFTNYVLKDITDAADSNNPVHVIPVAIGGASDVTSAFRSIAVGTGGTLIEATDANEVVGAIMQAINLLSQIPSPIFVDVNSTLDWNSLTYSWLPGNHNINADPCFVASYYLCQIAAGQDVNSPCVDTGSDSASVLDMNGYTTRTDGNTDSGIVDIGYHYLPSAAQKYDLNFTTISVAGLDANHQPAIVDPNPGSGQFNWYSVVNLRVSSPPSGYVVSWSGTDNDALTSTQNTVFMDRARTVTVTYIRNQFYLTAGVIGGHGTVSPTTGTYPRGAVVTLTAHPDAGYRVKQWTGTDANNDQYASTNTVTMNDDKTVTVEFDVPQMLTVPGTYTTIQAAIGAARKGDTVSVASGVYHNSVIVVDKEITVTSTNPDDPCVVASTIIDASGYADIAIVFGAGATKNTVFNGITVIGGTYFRIPAPNATQSGQNGPDGNGLEGGAVYIQSLASPTIRNCIIRDTNITGGNAGTAGNADATHPGGRGGWGGWARGGGIYIAPFANPTIINTTITNCSVIGGNGSNGGNSFGTYDTPGYQDANYGGLYSNPFANYPNPAIPWWELRNSNGQPYVGDYRFYSGYGGGVFCDSNSNATFIACSITNNRALGGMSGIGGTRSFVIPEPVIAYRIPSYGGGVYCGANSTVMFTDCNITGNIAPKPDATRHTDPYLGHGGGVAFEDTANIQFENCNITNNIAAVGGGIFCSGGTPEIRDSNVSRNIAYVGGGIYGMDIAGSIKGCTLYDNFAGVAPGDVNEVIGQGGGIFVTTANVDIVDCFLNANVTGASGGGIYVYGPVSDVTRVKNCLFVDNEAGRDGGALSVNWNAFASVENCTFYNNLATATFGEPGNTGFGGGLYCSYNANTSVIDSIFWDDSAAFGHEIAVETGFELDPRCGAVSVSHSDVQDGQAGAHVGATCSLSWDPCSINTDPLFINQIGGDFHLQQTLAGQSQNSPCVDAGSALASIVGLSMYTTRTDGVPDRSIVDMGYHYPAEQPCRFADLWKDGIINFLDFARVADAWLETDCNASNGWCGGADLTFDNHVGLEDLVVVTDCWLVADTDAPLPNPSQWAVEPHGIWPSSIQMRAVDANDILWGLPVEYYFDCVSGGCHDSGWRSDPNYTDVSLTAGVTYGYRVKTRDKDANNETEWSNIKYAVISNDTTAPTPNPMTWSVIPYAVSSTSAAMVATTATDASGVVYYQFADTNGVTSDWQSDPCYVATGLDPNIQHCFKVRAKDLYSNTTAWSEPNVCLSRFGDTNAPSPAPTIVVPPSGSTNNLAGPDANTYSGQFIVMTDANLPWWHKVIVDVTGIVDYNSSGPTTGPVEIRFICLDDSSLSSESKIPMTYRPIIIGQVTAAGSLAQHWRLTATTAVGTLTGNFIVYDVYVNRNFGTGRTLRWQVCAYDAAMNQICSTVHTIGP